MPFGFTFGSMDIPTWTIEIYVGNAMTQQQQLQMPYQMMAMQFAQIVNELANAPQPMKVILRGTKQVEISPDEWEDKPARIEYYNLKWDGEFE